MANPQLEDGHFRIANEIWWALCKIRIPGEARQILDFIIGKTYGYNKKEDWIAKSQFVKGTGICKFHVDRGLKKLIEMNVVTQKGNLVTNKGNCERLTYSFNKDYETWKELPKKVTTPKKLPLKVKGVTFIGKEVTFKGKEVTQKGAHIIQSTKDNIQKTILQEDTTKGGSAEKRKLPVTDHARIIEYWMNLYKERFGIKYDFRDAMDGSMISKMLKNFGFDKSCEIMETFLNTDDEFYRTKGGYTLGMLSSQTNKLAQRPILANDPLSKFSETSRHNIRVMQEWLKKKMEEPEDGKKPTAEIQ